MSFDYMQELTEKIGSQAISLPLLNKLTLITSQLMLNEIEICYWHTLNTEL